MISPREGTRRAGRRRRARAVWAAVLAGGLMPAVGCQVEYAGMTLPSGKYMYDDVQYFPPGPDFPWAETNAATQRARMQAMGMDVSDLPVPGARGPVMTPPPAAGALDPTQNRPNAPTDVNVQPLEPGGGAPPGLVPEPGAVPMPGPGDLVPPGGRPGF